jgi:hypothetical protein
MIRMLNTVCLHDTHAKYWSHRKCCYQFRWKFYDKPVPNSTAIYKKPEKDLSNRFHSRKEDNKQKTGAEEKLDEMGERWETAETWARTAKKKKLLNRHPYKTFMVHDIHDTHHEARQHFMNCYLLRIHAGETYLLLVVFKGEIWFLLTEYVKSLNNRFPMLIHKVVLRDVKVSVWCAMSATSIIGTIVWEHESTLISYRRTSILLRFINTVAELQNANVP